MEAKPLKCRRLAMKKSRILQPSWKISTPYTSYDPQLSIDGSEMTFIHQTEMRFLGQDIYKDLNYKEVRSKAEDKLKNLLQKTGRDQVTSTGKLWIYEYRIVSRIPWEFVINCFPISFAKNLQTVATCYLKSWASISRCANSSILYRKRENK